MLLGCMYLIETFNISFESTQNKQHFDAKINLHRVGGGEEGGGEEGGERELLLYKNKCYKFLMIVAKLCVCVHVCVCARAMQETLTGEASTMDMGRNSESQCG